jgi:hypothetical protein
MQSHESEGLHFRRERRFVIDRSNGRLRSLVLHVLAIAGGSALSTLLIWLVVRL